MMMQNIITSTTTTTTTSSSSSAVVVVEVGVTIFEADNMCTKDEMITMLSDVLRPLLIKCPTFPCIFSLWERIVRSKTGPGEYSVSVPMQIPMYFPHALETLSKTTGSSSSSSSSSISIVDLESIKSHLFPLEEKDVLSTQTPDASRIAWFAGKMTLTISPDDVWELTREIAELRDPPTPCHVKIHMSNLLFKSFADIDILLSIFRSESTDVPISVFVDVVRSHEDLCSLKAKFSNFTRYLQCIFTDKLADRVWYDLIRSRCGDNIFLMEMPFLFRMVTSGYDVNRIPANSVARLRKELVGTYNIPLDHDTDTKIGLFSSYIRLVIAKDNNTGVPLFREELWPDISPLLSALSLPPQQQQQPSSSSAVVGIKVWLYLSHVRYVSSTSEEDVWSLYSSQKKSTSTTTLVSKLIDWWHTLLITSSSSSPLLTSSTTTVSQISKKKSAVD